MHKLKFWENFDWIDGVPASARLTLKMAKDVKTKKIKPLAVVETVAPQTKPPLVTQLGPRDEMFKEYDPEDDPEDDAKEYDGRFYAVAPFGMTRKFAVSSGGGDPWFLANASLLRYLKSIKTKKSAPKKVVSKKNKSQPKKQAVKAPAKSLRQQINQELKRVDKLAKAGVLVNNGNWPHDVPGSARLTMKMVKDIKANKIKSLAVLEPQLYNKITNLTSRSWVFKEEDEDDEEAVGAFHPWKDFYRFHRDDFGDKRVMAGTADDEGWFLANASFLRFLKSIKPSLKN